MHRTFAALAVTICVLTPCHGSVTAAADEPVAPGLSAEDRDFFEKEVRPLLSKRCFECHGGTKAGGGLSLSTATGWQKGGGSGPAIVPGKPDESLLIDAINYRSLEMPPANKGGRLPADEIATLKRWVERGAPDPRDGSDVLGGMSRVEAAKWWAFQPLPEVDPIDTFGDARHIDALIVREIEQHGLRVAPPADKRTLIRRLTYDLTGLPPRPDDVRAFVADESPRALSQAVEGLLASPQYGVHWGRHWLDVVRYADTAGENTDRPLPHAWRYRNWVMEAFNRDLPFDQFVRFQLAGDVLANEPSGPTRSEGIVATGYLAIARRFGHDIDKDMHLTHEDVIDNLGKNFLGLTLGCARCHDHKYDPISSHDYYALYGVFESTRFSFPGCEPKGQPRDLVALLSNDEIDSLMKPWQEKVAAVEAEKQRRQAAAAAATESLTPVWSTTKTTLCGGHVNEGASVPFEQRVDVRKGELLVLSVSPNANHGADSTLVEWVVQEAGGEQRKWSLTDAVTKLTDGNPSPATAGAAWSFLETTTTPAFLADRQDSVEGNSSLKAWRLQDLPSVFVNSSDSDIQVWTTLAARSFFVHPAPNRPVAVAWTSPIDGKVLLTGRVADVHPASLDGVSFQVEHVASGDAGIALAALGAASVALPDAGPPPAIPVAYAAVEGSAKNARVHERGDPDKLGDVVPRRWLTVFGGDEVPTESGSGRRQLADWVSRHPVAARVIVNRVWEWHFGRGLVRTSIDFGSRGELPTHPELLDFLAAKFVHSGYSIKALHRLIVSTHAYQRASRTASANDPENRFLSHFSRRRLTAEELRDSLLTVSGRLDATWGEAHPFPDEKSWTFTQHAPFSAVYETNRRSPFLMVQRQRRHPFLALFDGADPNASTPSRQSTTVPTQALYFINDPFFHEQAGAFAGSLIDMPNDDARLLVVFDRLFQRQPTESEQKRLRAFVDQYPGDPHEKWSALARVLLGTNEFVFVE